MSARIALLANPGSGTGGAASAELALREQGASVERFGLADCDAAVASRPQRIVVAGGDGSVAWGAEAAGRAGVPLAVIPVGTANDFARAVGIPLDPAEAAELAIRGTRTRRLELGRMEGWQARRFVNAASAGLSPVAARNARGLKARLGVLAYVLGALRAGLRAEPLSCRVRCDGAEVFSGEAWQVTVACTGAFGAGGALDADPHDGDLDVVVIEAGSRARLVAHAYGIRTAGLEGQRGVRSFEGREVAVDTDGGTGFNVDGELVAVEGASFTAEPDAFAVVVGL